MVTTTASQPQTQLPQLIPREILFGNPERARPQISPDGKYLAYIAPDENNILQVWVRTVGQQDDRQLTQDKKRGIRMYFWTFDGEQLIYLQDADGDENWHCYAVNINTNIVRDLTPFQGVQAQPLALDHNFPHEFLVGLNLKFKLRSQLRLMVGTTYFTANPNRELGKICAIGVPRMKATLLVFLLMTKLCISSAVTMLTPNASSL